MNELSNELYALFIALATKNLRIFCSWNIYERRNMKTFVLKEQRSLLLGLFPEVIQQVSRVKFPAMMLRLLVFR